MRESATQGCLDTEALELFLREELEADARETARRHLDDCDSCRGELQELEENMAFLRNLPKVEQGEEPPERIGRFPVVDELGRGGMGTVFQVEDDQLRRRVALKIGRDPERADRVQEEALITGQLDHPGIVPVYEKGLDSSGRSYFVMRWVRGRELREVIELVHQDDPRWTLTAALGVLLKTCEAMAYAHSKGVIHRDLKPSNIFVGRYGEVHVMDWGLARSEKRPDSSSEHLRADVTRSVSSLRREARDWSEDSPLITRAGTVLGTPFYMPPEQADGRIEDIGPRSDVYSTGAILYHLLCGRAPYFNPGSNPSPYVVLARVLEGPPPPIPRLAKGVPEELQAICEKAMARDPLERYADMGELADDLRAYLEHRVVRAHTTGALAELRKWVERNRGVAALFLALLLSIVGGLSWNRAVEARGKRELDLSLDSTRVSQLISEADLLWPARPEKVEDMRDWLKRARALVDRIDHHERLRHQLEASARSAGTDELVFASPADEVRYMGVVRLVDDTRMLMRDAAGEQGLIDNVQRRLEFAQDIQWRSLEEASARTRWKEAIASIRSWDSCPAYRGLEITPQLGLIPIGRSVDSGLWEFAHLQTGDPPERDRSGRLIMTEETGLVFVLIPDASYLMGAQSHDPEGLNYALRAEPDEVPVHEVAVDAFFISKYEMTQGQWKRHTGENPSYVNSSFALNMVHPVPSGFEDLRPVEQVTWTEATRVLHELDLELPSEEQWEYACRAGTHTPFSFGTGPKKIADYGNVRDLAHHDWFDVRDREPPAFDDMFGLLAPIGSYLPNAFGLHDMHGNVSELCSNGFQLYDDRVQEPLDDVVVSRGGGWSSLVTHSRSSSRFRVKRDVRTASMGLRPARALILSED